MTLNMDDDLDMTMRAPYISMSEASELPMLIAEDLMWGAQPDLKQTLNVNKKVEVNVKNQQRENVQKQKSTMESSLASLLCSQLMQHHQQQQQMQEQQMEQQIILSPEVKIKILDHGGNFTIVSQNQDARMGLWWRWRSSGEHLDWFFLSLLAPESMEWTMNDLLQLKKPKINLDDRSGASVGHINQNQPTEPQTVKCREKSSMNHKRPSLSCEISSSKRAKSQDSIKTTPQLLQQLIASPGCDLKNRPKIQKEPSTSSEAKWSPQKLQQQPASNSVLMNLLVSGCDVSAGYYTCLPRPKVAKA